MPMDRERGTYLFGPVPEVLRGVPSEAEWSDKLSTLRLAAEVMAKTKPGLSRAYEQSPEWLVRSAESFLDLADFLEAAAVILRTSECRIVEAAVATIEGRAA